MNRNTLRRNLFAAFGALTLAGTAVPAFAADDNLLSAGAAYSHPEQKGVGGLQVDDQGGAALDYRHFFNRNWALDLGVGESRHSIAAGGTTFGSTRVVPLTVTGQYYVDTGTLVRPYVGAGLNYTSFDSRRLNDADIDRHSTGAALQVGALFDLGKRLTLTTQVEHDYSKANLSAAGQSLGDAKLDPYVASVQVGYTF